MPSSKIIHTDFKGLVTAPGPLERAESSCVVAKNVVFDAPGVVRKRKGFSKQTGNTGGPVFSAFTSRLMGDKVLVHVGTPSPTALFYGDGSVALTTIPITAPALTRSTAVRAQMAMCQRNHYVTGDQGAARIESSMETATQRMAGMPRGMSPAVYANWWAGYAPLVAGTNMGDGYARSYRVTWHLKDADGIEMGGAPTGRSTVRNQSGIAGWIVGTTRNVALRIPIPRELGTIGTAVTTSWFFRLWGTRTFNAAGGEFGNDECFLLAEQYLVAGDITATYATYTDSTPDSFLSKQRLLHTNANNYPDSEIGLSQGTTNEDAPPPIAGTVAYWSDAMWYGDLSFRPRATTRLLVVGGAGLVAGDTVDVTGPTGAFIATLTGAAASAAANQFTVFTGLATTQMNVEATASAIVDAININAGATVGCRAYYVSVGNSAPGRIYLEAHVNAAADVMSFIPSRAVAFSGLVGGGTNSAIDTQANGIMFSKPYRADAVPPVNIFSAGPGDARVLRLHPFRGRMLAFTDYGIYQVVGRSHADFSVMPFDLGYRLMVRESVVTCDEKVYAWCYEGIIEIDDGGVTVISAPIEPTITQALLACGVTLAAGQVAFSQIGFSVAYRYEHRVHFYFPETPAAGSGAGANVGSPAWLSFDTRTRAWSTGNFDKKLANGYTDSRSCGVVRFSDDRLVLAVWSTGADTKLLFEARDFTAADFTDNFSDGSSAAVGAVLQFQYQQPIQDGAVHWQQWVFNFDGGEQAWRPLPTALAVGWVAQPGTVSGSASMASNTSSFWRAETPTTCRRATRLQVQLTHSVAEYFGLTGVALTVRAGTKFVGRSS